MSDTTGAVGLRAENTSAIVTGFALQEFKMRQLAMVETSTSWSESYYKESKAELVGGTGANIRGIPRLAAFPYSEVSWTKVSSYLEKYGNEGVISIEDERFNNIGTMTRTMLRIGRSVANAEDIYIESTIAGTSGINTYAITIGNEWNSATVANRDPVYDILAAEQKIAEDNYDILDGNGYLVVNPKDYTNMLRNSKFINSPTYKSADVVTNGVVGQVCGLKVLVTNACTASQAYVVKAKEALTLKQAQALTVVTIDDPGIKKTIRAYEIIALQVPNPEAICKITNTAI